VAHPTATIGAMSDNNITLAGNLTRDPELRFIASGRAVVNFGLAVNRSYKKNDEWVDETAFFDVNAWAELAENTAASLSKGDRVIVTGRLNQRSYETREGEKRTVVEVLADDIGASVKRATMEVTRIKREQPAGGYSKSLPDEEPF